MDLLEGALFDIVPYRGAAFPKYTDYDRVMVLTLLEDVFYGQQ